MNALKLKEKAIQIRIKTVEGVYNAQSGHPGGSLSIADILSVLYFEKMNIDPANPKDPDRDRLVLSKGHAAPSYYGALALRGYFSTDEIAKLRQIDSFLQGHPDMKKVPGVDMSSGSLGQGLSAANGMALYAKRKGKLFRVYVILGDGEMQEGQVWEAMMTAAHYKLDNLTAFVDVNRLQIDGPVAEIMNDLPLEEKFASFGWHIISIDGNDVEAIASAVDQAKTIKDKPVAVLCHTVKGKGVPLMENQVSWHGVAPNKEQAEGAFAALEAQLAKLKEEN